MFHMESYFHEGETRVAIVQSDPYEDDTNEDTEMYWPCQYCLIRQAALMLNIMSASVEVSSDTDEFHVRKLHVQDLTLLLIPMYVLMGPVRHDHFPP